jgi:hypothetical protein
VTSLHWHPDYHYHKKEGYSHDTLQEAMLNKSFKENGNILKNLPFSGVFVQCCFEHNFLYYARTRLTGMYMVTDGFG